MTPVYISLKLEEKTFTNNPVYNICNDSNLNTIESNLNTIEDNDFKECRICLESHGDLIVVCGCKGSCQYVHKKCIEEWIQLFSPNDDKYKKCEICKTDYNFDLLDLELSDNSNCSCSQNSKISFLLFVYSLFIIVILFILLIIWL